MQSPPVLASLASMASYLQRPPSPSPIPKSHEQSISFSSQASVISASESKQSDINALDNRTVGLIHHQYLDTLDLVVNSELHMLICNICQTAILPVEINAHIMTKHQDRQQALLAVDKHRLEQAIVETGVINTLPVLQGPRAAVEGLSIHDAIACDYCHIVFTSQKKMQIHHAKFHSSIPTPHAWRTCKAQHLKNGGPGTLRSYWEVMMNRDEQENDPIQVLIRSVIEEIEPTLQVLQLPQDDREISPWLLTTRWHEHIAGLQPSHLCNFISLPKDNEEDMPKLRENVKAYFEEALELLSTTDELILKRLNSPDPLKQ